MLTSAQRRELIRSQRHSDRLLPVVVRRLIAGRDPQPPWLPRRLATVVAHDLDRDAGVGAVRIVRRPGSARAETITGAVERSAGTWTHTGGASDDEGPLPGPRLAVGRTGQVGILDVRSDVGLRSHAHMGAHPGRAHEAPWVGTTEIQVAAEADHLLVAGRRVDVPAHGLVLLAWTLPSTAAYAAHPLIVAVAPDGTELSRLEPGESTDSYTWRLLAAP